VLKARQSKKSAAEIYSKRQSLIEKPVDYQFSFVDYGTSSKIASKPQNPEAFSRDSKITKTFMKT